MILPPEKRSRCFLTYEHCPLVRKSAIIYAHKRLMAGEAKCGKAYDKAIARKVDEQNEDLGVNISMLKHYHSRIRYNKPDRIVPRVETEPGELEDDLEPDDDAPEVTGEETDEDSGEETKTTDSGSLLDVIPPSILRKMIGNLD